MVDEILSEVRGAVAWVRVKTQLWPAQIHGTPATFHWVQVKVVGRQCQGLPPLEYVGPPCAKVQAPLKHLFAVMTAQMPRICPRRLKTNHRSPAQTPELRPSLLSALQHDVAQVSEPSPSHSATLEHASASTCPNHRAQPIIPLPLEHGPGQVPRPSTSPASPLHIPSVKSVAKDLHRKASKGDKLCAVFTHHLHIKDRGYLHWGKVLVVEGSECTMFKVHE